MNPSPAPEHRALSKYGWIAALPLVPLVLGAWNEIQEYDPTEYAAVARHIFRSGDWVHLRNALGPYLDKPPLTFWLMQGPFHLLGLTSLAVRLPALVLGGVLLLTVAEIGALLWDRPTGVWAALLLGASLAFQLMVLDPKVDMTVTACIAVTVLFLLKARVQERWVWAAWGCAALGLLAKGPIGFVAPAMAVFPEAIRRPWKQDASGQGLWARLRTFQPVLGPLLMAALVLPWYWAVAREYGAGGPRFLLWQQSFGRVLGSTYRNRTGPLFFVHTALWAYLPFTPWLVAGLLRRAWRWKQEAFRFPPDPTRIVLWWWAIPFIAISCSSYKLPQYSYWVAPPAALMAARFLTAELPRRDSGTGKALLGISLFLAAIVPLAIGGLMVFCFPPVSSLTLVLWTLGASGAVLAAIWAARRRPLGSRLVLLSCTAFGVLDLFLAGYLHPALLHFQPDREWGALAKQEDPKGRVLPFFETEATQGASFYADREVQNVTPADLRQLVAQGQSRVVVTTEKGLQALTSEGMQVSPLSTLPSFPTSRPSGRFLLEKTRPQVTQMQVMARLSLNPAPRSP